MGRLRPFLPPVLLKKSKKIVDLTNDVPFERKWEPIEPANIRIPESHKDPEDKYDYIYDRRQVDRGLFEAFQDQGDAMRKFRTPADCAADQAFWKEEQESAVAARAIIEQLSPVRPHDLFDIAPQGYNLSI